MEQLRREVELLKISKAYEKRAVDKAFQQIDIEKKYNEQIVKN